MLLHNAAYSVLVDTFEKDIWVIKREKRHFFEKKVHFFVIFFGGLLFLLCRVKELEGRNTYQFNAFLILVNDKIKRYD